MTSTTSVARLQGDIDMTTGEGRGEEKRLQGNIGMTTGEGRGEEKRLRLK